MSQLYRSYYTATESGGIVVSGLQTMGHVHMILENKEQSVKYTVCTRVTVIGGEGSHDGA
jgi:Tfp pilus assembly protein PilZ